MLYLPYPLMIDEATARALREYVENGGALVSEARLAWNDERGRAREIIPGSGLHEVCGCRETAVQQTVTGKTELTLAADFAALKAGEKIKGALYEETLTPLGTHAKVMAAFADGSPAMISPTFGKGRMLTIGTFLGNAYEVERDETTARFLRALLDWAGVHAPVETSAPQVEVRMLESGETRIVFAFNHGEPVDAAIALHIPPGEYEVRDLESGNATKVTSDRRLRLARTLPANGVVVMAVRRSGS